jgi:hypothetical protein
MTARGGLRIVEAHDGLRIFASESLTVQSWSHRVALCLSEKDCIMSRRTVLTEVGPDGDAVHEADRSAILFDLGLGARAPRRSRRSRPWLVPCCRFPMHCRSSLPLGSSTKHRLRHTRLSGRDWHRSGGVDRDRGVGAGAATPAGGRSPRRARSQPDHRLHSLRNRATCFYPGAERRRRFAPWTIERCVDDWIVDGL